MLCILYNASNNELVRTQTLVIAAIVQVDAASFRQCYLTHFGVEIGRKKKPAAGAEEAETATEDEKKSSHVWRKSEKRHCVSMDVQLIPMLKSNLAVVRRSSSSFDCIPPWGSMDVLMGTFLKAKSLHEESSRKRKETALVLPKFSYCRLAI